MFGSLCIREALGRRFVSALVGARVGVRVQNVDESVS